MKSSSQNEAFIKQLQSVDLTCEVANKDELMFRCGQASVQPQSEKPMAVHRQSTTWFVAAGIAIASFVGGFLLPSPLSIGDPANALADDDANMRASDKPNEAGAERFLANELARSRPATINDQNRLSPLMRGAMVDNVFAQTADENSNHSPRHVGPADVIRAGSINQLLIDSATRFRGRW